MLNPPLSLLPDDLFYCIVDHVAELPSPNGDLCRLSIVDRAFTQFCQAHIFKVLYFGDRYEDSLEVMREILDDKPSFANHVREVTLNYQDGWLFNDPIFINIFQLLAKSSRPPHKLNLFSTDIFICGDPMLVIGRLMRPFFSQSLTVLHLDDCSNVPLFLFLFCTGLKELLLENVEVSEASYDQYPDSQCSGREFPTLDSLDFWQSGKLIKQMITPPPNLYTAVVLWSKLRVLTLCAQEKDEIDCLQPILDLTCNTLEELYLTKCRLLKATLAYGGPLPLAGLVNLSNLSSLRVFALYAFIPCLQQEFATLRDVNLVLRTIPTSNKVISLAFHFTASSDRPFPEKDWVGLCGQVVRISGGEHLKLNLDVKLFLSRLGYLAPGEAKLGERINKKIVTSLSKHSNICTQFNILPP